MLKLHSIKTVSFGEALLIRANAQAHGIKHQAVSAVSFGITQHWKEGQTRKVVSHNRVTRRKTKSTRLVPRGVSTCNRGRFGRLSLCRLVRRRSSCRPMTLIMESASLVRERCLRIFVHRHKRCISDRNNTGPFTKTLPRDLGEHTSRMRRKLKSSSRLGYCTWSPRSNY
jgi:hypothetical protein